jgi:outer membrane protein TolC
VADCLRVLEGDAQTLQARSAAAEQLSGNYDIATQRFALGGVSELSMLDARRQRLQSQLDRSRAEAQRFTDTAALLHALAGAPG